MGNRQDEIMGYRQALVVLNGNKERGRLSFLAATGIGLLLGVILAAMGLWWMGLVVFAAPELLLGIPGYLQWQRAERKTRSIRATLGRLEAEINHE